MKRFLSFVAMAMLCMGAFAQPSLPKFRSGEMNKGFDYLMAHNSRIITCQGGELLIATWETRSFLGAFMPWGLQVVAVDTNMNVLRQVKLPDTRMSELVFANYVDGKVYLLYREQFIAVYHRAVIEPQSMTIESCEAMKENAQGKDVNAYHWNAKSGNGLFYGVEDVFVNSVSGEMVHRQILFDEKMETLWEKRFEANEVSNLKVTDDGEMILFGSRYDKDSRETVVAVHVLDVDDEKSVVERVAIGEVHRLSLLNVVGSSESPTRYAVAAGYIRTPDSPKKRDCFDQMVGLSLNLRSGELKAKAVRFTSDELNVFGNKGLKKENKVGMADALVMVGSAETGYGGVLMLQRVWKVTTHSTKNPDVHTYYTMGSLAMAVDTTGTILWHKPFRTVNAERTGQGNDIPCYGDAPMIGEGDNVYVMLPEQSKTTDTYDITQPALNVALGNRAHSFVVYGIDRQGDVVKQVLLQKDKASLMNNIVRQAPGRYLGIYAFHKKSALVYVNF